MNRVIVSGLALLTAAALAACQQAPASDKAAAELKAEKEKTAALEQRIAELEKKAEAPGAPAVASNLQAPASAAVAAPLPVERKPARRATTATRTRVVKRTTPASSSRVSVIPEERSRVEEPGVRTDRTDRTDRSRERDPWATTGDPGPRREEIPAGTSLTLVLENGLSTVNSREGQPVTARIERAVSEDGRVVLPGVRAAGARDREHEVLGQPDRLVPQRIAQLSRLRPQVRAQPGEGLQHREAEDDGRAAPTALDVGPEAVALPSMQLPVRERQKHGFSEPEGTG